MTKFAYSGRTDQVKASLQRWKDAQKLQFQERWRGAVYLAGYTVECKLKVQLMQMYGVNHLQQLEKEIESRTNGEINLFTHKIEVLFELTGARSRMLNYPIHQKTIRAYHRCNSWSPSWRYAPDQGTRDECEMFMQAVKDFGCFIDNNA